MTRPRVLFINRVYPPASGATGTLLSELTPALTNAGWNVTVLTGPASDAPASETTSAGVRVERVSGLRLTRTSTLKRAVAYCSLYPSVLTRALRLPTPDVVVTETDPPLQLVLGGLLRRLTGARAVHWAQDLYPEVAEELGVIPQDGMLAHGLRRLSTTALRSHDHIVAVGRCMKERLQRRGLPPEHVSVIPNWPPASVHPVPHAENDFRTEHELDGRFVVMYSGNMGLAHPFDTVLDAAAALQDSHPDVLFLFIGEGPRKAELQAQVDERRLANVRFLPFQPRERLAESLSAADLHLVTMQPELRGLVVPSKIYGVMAAARPTLFLGPPESEASRLLREYECGTVLPTPSGSALARAIRTRCESPEYRAATGRRAHEAVASARSDAFHAFHDVLRNVLDTSPAPLSEAQPNVTFT